MDQLQGLVERHARALEAANHSEDQPCEGLNEVKLDFCRSYQSISAYQLQAGSPDSYFSSILFAICEWKTQQTNSGSTLLAWKQSIVSKTAPRESPVKPSKKFIIITKSQW